LPERLHTDNEAEGESHVEGGGGEGGEYEAAHRAQRPTKGNKPKKEQFEY
jgi:hypothetical protein